jgi:hypothetical protein
MGMGISVSVDSWVQQTLEDITQNVYPPGDPVYRRLVSSATFPSEILIVESDFFVRFMKCPKGNILNVLRVCLELLIAKGSGSRLNAAALLCRILPFLCSKDSEIGFQDFILGKQSLFDTEFSPAVHIVESALSLLASFKDAQGDFLVTEVNAHIVMFDLLALSIFLLRTFCENSTLFHQIVVTAQNFTNDLASVFFNYVSLGGREESIISLFSVLLFHATAIFTGYDRVFLEAGGQICSQLLIVNDRFSDVLCFLCALGFPEDHVQPPLKQRNEHLVRLGLVKALMTESVNYTGEVIAGAFQMTQSLLARALMARIGRNVSAGVKELCQPLKDFVFRKPCESEVFLGWIEEALSQLFLSAKSVLLEGTGLRVRMPDFKVLDSLILQRGA